MPNDYHALLSPSKAAMWIECANSLAANEGQPEGDKKAADLGTDKHEILALCLENNIGADNYIGHRCGKGHDVDGEFAAQVQKVVEWVHERIDTLSAGGARVQVEIEQDVPIEHITGEPEATGRADVVLIAEYDDHLDIEVWDAKFGYSEVLPDNNPQGMMYASGAIEKFSLLGDFRQCTVVIAQPAINDRPKEWTFDVPMLNQWVEDIASPAADKAMRIHRIYTEGERALKDVDFNPGDKQCEWCKAKARCPALTAKLEEAVGQSFETLADGNEELSSELLSNETMGRVFPVIPLLEKWVKALQAAVEHELMNGREVPGCKLVEGRKGNRKWADDAKAEEMLKGMRVKEVDMYKFTLLGPKPILEHLKDQPRRLKKVEAMVVQDSGKPHVTLDTDPRPALKIAPPDTGFETEDNDLC